MEMPPSWVFTMMAVCLAAFLVGWIIAWALNEFWPP
jgi:hypothetical protein